MQFQPGNFWSVCIRYSSSTKLLNKSTKHGEIYTLFTQEYLFILTYRVKFNLLYDFTDNVFFTEITIQSIGCLTCEANVLFWIECKTCNLIINFWGKKLYLNFDVSLSSETKLHTGKLENPKMKKQNKKTTTKAYKLQKPINYWLTMNLFILFNK